jgi:hypothetical protein
VAVPFEKQEGVELLGMIGTHSVSLIFLPDRSLSELISRADTDIDAWCGLASRYASVEQMENAFAGALLQRMKYSRRFTKECIASPRCRLRLAALWLALEYYSLTPVSFAEDCLHAAFEDHVAAVRGLALANLVYCRRYIEDPTGTLGKLLAEVLSDELADARENARAVLSELKETQQLTPAIQAGLLKHWTALAPSRVDAFLRDREAAVAHIEDPDPKTREAAIWMLYQHWKPDKSVADQCVRLFGTEREVGVLRAALGLVAEYYEESESPEIRKALASLCLCESAEEGIRLAAYRALHSVQGTPLLASPLVRECQSLQDIDWDFVHVFASVTS